MMNNSALAQTGGLSLLAAAGAYGVETALKVKTAVKDAVMVLTSLDEASY